MAKIELSRTRFANDIVAEFLPPERDSKKVAILSAGAPGYPGGKAEVMLKLSRLGYWVIVPRYRGTWESGGTFLEHSPAEDIRLVMDEVGKGFDDLWSGTRHCVRDAEFYLLGGSFGGPAAILNSADPRVKKAVAISAVADWREQENTLEPLDMMSTYVPNAFGEAYRAAPEVWQKLTAGDFYNPVNAKDAADGTKLLFIHAHDDRVVHAAPAQAFAKEIGARFVLLSSGGHMGVGSALEPSLWRHIDRFLKQK